MRNKNIADSGNEKNIFINFFSKRLSGFFFHRSTKIIINIICKDSWI